MIDIEPIDQLLSNKDLALQVFREIPKNANRMRINQGHAMFYISLLIDGEDLIWRYLRYKNDYVPLALKQNTLEQFEKINGVFCVDQFRLLVFQLYTNGAYTQEELSKIKRNKPIGATAYDPIDCSYWRVGLEGYLERYDQMCFDSHKWKKTVEIESQLDLMTIKI